MNRFGTKGRQYLTQADAKLLSMGYSYKSSITHPNNSNIVIHKYMNAGGKIVGINENFKSGNHLVSINLESSTVTHIDFDYVVSCREQQRKNENLAELSRIEKNKTVTVVRGRKVPIGTRGQVFWIGNNGYGESVGIIAADGSKHFTAIGNVEVTPLPEGELTAIQAASDASKAAWKANNPRPAFVPNKSYASHGRRRYAY
jgi:hypothetical protein